MCALCAFERLLGGRKISGLGLRKGKCQLLYESIPETFSFRLSYRYAQERRIHFVHTGTCNYS